MTNQALPTLLCHLEMTRRSPTYLMCWRYRHRPLLTASRSRRQQRRPHTKYFVWAHRSGSVNRREHHRRRSKDSSTLVWWQDLMQAPACDSVQDSFIYCRMGQAPRAVGCCKSTLAMRCLVHLDLGMNKGNTSRRSNHVASPSLL